MKPRKSAPPSSDEAQAHTARRSFSGRGPWRQFAMFLGALVAILVVVWLLGMWPP